MSELHDDPRVPCTTCGALLHTGEARVIVSFTVTELLALALGQPSRRLSERLYCAASLLDREAVDLAKSLIV